MTSFKKVLKRLLRRICICPFICKQRYKLKPVEKKNKLHLDKMTQTEEVSVVVVCNTPRPSLPQQSPPSRPKIADWTVF